MFRSESLKIKMAVPDLMSPNLGVQLCEEEERLLAKARESSKTSIDVFFKLMDSARLDLSRNRWWDRIIFAFIKRRNLHIEAYDNSLKITCSMEFSFPAAVLEDIVTRPIANLIDHPENIGKFGACNSLRFRIVADLRVFRILLQAAGQFSDSLRIIDLEPTDKTNFG